MQPSFKATEIFRDDAGHQKPTFTAYTVSKRSGKASVPKEANAAVLQGRPRQSKHFLGIPQELDWVERVSKPTKYRQVGMQHRNRPQAPTPQGQAGVNEGESMSTVGCTSTEPADKNNPITTHAPTRAPDSTTLNPPPPTMPRGKRANGDIQWRLIQHR